MTFKIKMLTAAAVIAFPAAAMAQTAQPATGPVPTTPQPRVQPQPQPGPIGADSTISSAPAGQQVIDEQPRQAEQPATQPMQQPPVEDSSESPMQSGVQTPPAPAGTQTQTPPAEAQTSAQAQTGSTGPATAADVRAGVEVRDPAGAMVGTVESADADSAIVSTGSVRADIPIASFGRSSQGLVLAMTRAELEAAARARMPTPS
ncbi:MAG: hypothetical protein AB7O91_05890 [Sphingomonas sp.]